MIRVRQIEVSINNNSIDEIKNKTAKKLRISPSDIKDIIIKKESIDARHKDNIKYIYEVDVDTDKSVRFDNDIFETPDEIYKYEITGSDKLNEPIVIVGAGPAGLFAAYMLTQNNYPVILIERGEKVEDRVKTIEEFWNNNKLDLNSNIQFGEGGAGTFSDGKLNTLKKDKEFRQKKVFEIFRSCGAPEDIMYSNKPHIGTDILRCVIVNMRNKIIEFGGVIRYNTTLTDININNEKIESIIVNNNEEIKTSNLVLAIGNSARDTVEMLLSKNITITPKPFAVGVRIQHPQEMINKSQYGEYGKVLPPCSYKLTYQASNNRGVYTFCMCPGGYVVNASSEDKRIAINGMSDYKRDSLNANSALVVTVSSKDFGDKVTDAIEFTRKLESSAYIAGKGLIPIQTYKGFKENKIYELGSVKPVFKGNYNLANLNEILPSYVNDALKEAIEYFGTKIKGYNMDDAILAAVESRTSSPIRIDRNEDMLSNIDGIYPIGEGSGYAGVITTSAMDGLKLFEAIIKKYRG